MPKRSKPGSTAKRLRRPMQPDLGRTQRWLQAVILAQGSCQQAIASPAARRQIPLREARAAVLPSPTLTAGERLDIYRDMYEARLVDALEADYPRLSGYLGEQRFRELARLYIRRRQSRSYTLNRLGDRLPGFIRREVDGLRRPAFVYDLARFELTLTEVFDEAETSPVSAEALAEVPADQWESARLRPVAAFRLLELRYPVHEPDPKPRRKAVRLAVYRRNYEVCWIEVSCAAYGILEALARGKKLGQAIRAARASRSRLPEWFREWTSLGFFQAVDWSSR